MRQRKVKNEAEKLASLCRYTVERPMEQRGQWNELFRKEQPLFLEVGCGRGQFITTLARKHQEYNFLGIEGSGSVVLRALEKCEKGECSNLLFIPEYVNEIGDFFKEGELWGVYLNFSDPWPKERHKKRRLIHRRFLESYQKVIKSGGFIAFKTDNEGLYSFALEEFSQVGLDFLEKSEDLHGSELEAREVTTEYEDKFRHMGKPIYYCKALIK